MERCRVPWYDIPSTPIRLISFERTEADRRRFQSLIVSSFNEPRMSHGGHVLFICYPPESRLARGSFKRSQRIFFEPTSLLCVFVHILFCFSCLHFEVCL